MSGYKALVIGFGSIGKRHARLLSQLGCEVEIVSAHAVADYAVHRSLSEALDAIQPDYVVISNRTSEHRDTLAELLAHAYNGKVLIEKPLFQWHDATLDAAGVQAAVGYNLRFDPVIAELGKLLAGKRSLMVSISAGQHLSEWRPDTDYTQSYSASAGEGGGVLRDISHELDYCLWLFGGFSRVSAVGGNYGVLGIEADELWSITAETSADTVCTLRLSYLDRPARRDIDIITDDCTIRADLVHSTIAVDGEQVFRAEPSRDQSYLDMHRAMLEGDMQCLCSIDEGLSVLKAIEAIECASSEKRWVAL